MEYILCCIEIKKKQRYHLFTNKRYLALYTRKAKSWRNYCGGGPRKQNKATGHEWVKCLHNFICQWRCTIGFMKPHDFHEMPSLPVQIICAILWFPAILWPEKKANWIESISSQITVVYLFSKESDSVHTCTYSFISHPENDKTVLQSFNA